MKILEYSPVLLSVSLQPISGILASCFNVYHQFNKEKLIKWLSNNQKNQDLKYILGAHY